MPRKGFPRKKRMIRRLGFFKARGRRGPRPFAKPTVRKEYR